MHRRSALVWVLALTVLLLAGATACGSDHQSTKATGSLKVYAAASLTESFQAEQATLERADPGLAITYNFAGSGMLVTNIQQGAPADVIATADTASMKKLVDRNLVETPTTFAKNKLEILVAPGNPKGVRKLADLARRDLTFVTEDDTVPAGKYSARVLKAAGVTAHPVSKEVDVKSAVAKVTGGEADVTIVYVSDVRAAGSKGQGVQIPDAQNVTAEYPIAIVKATKHHAAAASFVRDVVHGSGQLALKQHGFLAAG